MPKGIQFNPGILLQFLCTYSCQCGIMSAMEFDSHRRILNRCGITDIEEKEYTNIGRTRYITAKFKGFTLRYQNYYWVVSGEVPIDMAMKLFEDPVGKTDIRSNGHCGCPSPMENGIKWIASDGREVIKTRNIEDFKSMEYLQGVFAPEEVMSRYIFNDDPESIGATASVNMYHIDSELGLYIFIQAVKSL